MSFCNQGAAMTVGIHVYMKVVPALFLQMGNSFLYTLGVASIIVIYIYTKRNANRNVQK